MYTTSGRDELDETAENQMRKHSTISQY